MMSWNVDCMFYGRVEILCDRAQICFRSGEGSVANERILLLAQAVAFRSIHSVIIFIAIENISLFTCDSVSKPQSA